MKSHSDGTYVAACEDIDDSLFESVINDIDELLSDDDFNEVLQEISGSAQAKPSSIPVIDLSSDDELETSLVHDSSACSAKPPEHERCAGVNASHTSSPVNHERSPVVIGPHIDPCNSGNPDVSDASLLITDQDLLDLGVKNVSASFLSYNAENKPSKQSESVKISPVQTPFVTDHEHLRSSGIQNKSVCEENGINIDLSDLDIIDIRSPSPITGEQELFQESLDGVKKAISEAHEPPKKWPDIARACQYIEEDTSQELAKSVNKPNIPEFPVLISPFQKNSSCVEASEDTSKCCRATVSLQDSHNSNFHLVQDGPKSEEKPTKANKNETELVSSNEALIVPTPPPPPIISELSLVEDKCPVVPNLLGNDWLPSSSDDNAVDAWSAASTSSSHPGSSLPDYLLKLDFPSSADSTSLLCQFESATPLQFFTEQSSHPSTDQHSLLGQEAEPELSKLPTGTLEGSGGKDKASGRVPSWAVPYVSTDEAENADNNNPEWGLLGDLQTDEERCCVVRSIWRQPEIPNPRRDLTCHNYLRKPKTMSNGTRKRTRSEDPSTEENPQKRRRVFSCMGVFEKKIQNLHEQFDQEVSTLQADHDRELKELGINQQQEMDEFLSTSAPSYILQHHIDIMLSKQEREISVINAKFSSKLDKHSSTNISKIQALEKASEEVVAFNKFYSGDHCGISEEDVQQFNETEQMYDLFDQIYG